MELIKKLNNFVDKFKLEGVFLSGEYVRSLFTEEDAKIIDVVCVQPEIVIQLGELFATEILHIQPQIQNDICIINVEDYKIIFQSRSLSNYMKNEDIIAWFQQNGIENSPINNNVYGRNFTINSLLYDFSTDKVYDLTQRAFNDIDKKIIASVLPPELLLKYDPMAALKSLRLALQYEFFVETQLKIHIHGVIDNLTHYVSRDKIQKEIAELIKMDGEKGLDLIEKYKLDKFIDKELLKHLE